MSAYHDRWLLPTRQCDYPGLDLVPDTILHGRREGSFLVLVAIAFTASLVAPISGGWIDIAAVLDLKLPFATVIPFGVLALPIGLAATIVACELFRGRRAVSLAFAVGLAAFAVAGLSGATPTALALATGVAVMHLSGAVVFDAFHLAHGRQFWLRALIAMLFAELAGWAAFGGVLLLANVAQDAVINVATACIIYSAAGVVVVMIPAVIAKRIFGRYLRVAGLAPLMRRRSAATVEPVELVERSGRVARGTVQPYSSAEMQFFSDGERLEDADLS
jgi:hypothetical protein